MAKPTVDELRATLIQARDEYARCVVAGQVAAVSQELEERAAREEVIASEDALDARLNQLSAERGRVVLSGDALIRDVDLVRAEVARSRQILKCRATASDDRDFVRQCLELKMCDLRQAIRRAVPASEAKERLQHSLAAIDSDYAIVTGHLEDREALAAIIASTLVDKSVDEAWFAQQAAELVTLDKQRAPVRSPVQSPVLTR
jgi:hypothetical protein